MHSFVIGLISLSLPLSPSLPHSIRPSHAPPTPFLQYSLLLCNALGTPVDSRYVEMGGCIIYGLSFSVIYIVCTLVYTILHTLYVHCDTLCAEPSFVSISHTHIVAASKTAFFVWYYRTPSRLAAPELTQVSSRKGREGHDRLIHADDHPSEASAPTVDFKKATIVSDK